MFDKLIGLFGDSNEKMLKQLHPTIEAINRLEESLINLSIEQLRMKTTFLKERARSNSDLEGLLPEVFALVRESARRVLGQRHFDVQLMGGVVLYQGKIAEMKTGEGKTLVATLPATLNALSGRGVHIITVNDYLAKRDAQWMGPVYNLMGLTVGCLQHDSAYMFDADLPIDTTSFSQLRSVSRQEVYQADITYGTNNEFGFDYLRDNMVADLSQCVQRELAYAIVDEVDNILIDEARTPLIISGAAQEPTQLYYKFSGLVPRLQEALDYTVDPKHKVATLTESGIGNIERWLNLGNLYDPANYYLTHYIENALKAHALYRRDTEYVVRDGQVILVDEFTGRLMPGRRLSDGLHQALEAKEGVKVQQETITYATITLQNYFRMYEKLAGMTGTAATEAEEFWKIYRLDVVIIPTHRPMVREELTDLIYRTERGKLKAIADKVQELHDAGRPVLVGTVSIEKSELLAEMLKQRGVPHQVLNAKHHEKEASIIAQAGGAAAVTVATNMAGRGTDILLGGNPEGLGMPMDQWEQHHQSVVVAGGLYVIGSERHEARRIDNQLRGRCGRQGDPGGSRFYVSLEDEILRRFGGDRIRGLMEWAGMEEDVPIENRLVSRAVENAQVRVEAYHFDVRKHLVEFDDVINRHREVIYADRHRVITGADLKTQILEMVQDELSQAVDAYLPGDQPQDWSVEALLIGVREIFGDETNPTLGNAGRQSILSELHHRAEELYASREQEVGMETMRTLERLVMLRVIDALWVQHLTAMEHLRHGIGLAAVGQRDPLMMYKREGSQYFQSLLARIQRDMAHTIFRVGITDRNAGSRQRRSVASGATVNTILTTAAAQQQVRAQQIPARRVGRNDPCPCESGKKYKKCHGALT